MQHSLITELKTQALAFSSKTLLSLDFEIIKCKRTMCKLKWKDWEERTWTKSGKTIPRLSGSALNLVQLAAFSERNVCIGNLV